MSKRHLREVKTAADLAGFTQYYCGSMHMHNDSEEKVVQPKLDLLDPCYSLEKQVSVM